MQLFIAAKALIEKDGKFLILREATYAEGTNAGKWGVPGGRLKPGERIEDVLAREVKEETGLDVTIGKPVYVGEWRPTVKGEEWQIIGIFFLCTNPKGDITLSEEHDTCAWISPEELGSYTIMDPEPQAILAALK